MPDKFLTLFVGKLSYIYKGSLVTQVVCTHSWILRDVCSRLITCVEGVEIKENVLDVSHEELTPFLLTLTKLLPLKVTMTVCFAGFFTITYIDKVAPFTVTMIVGISAKKIVYLPVNYLL